MFAEGTGRWILNQNENSSYKSTFSLSHFILFLIFAHLLTNLLSSYNNVSHVLTGEVLDIIFKGYPVLIYFYYL